VAGIGRADAGPAPGQLDVEGVLFRAALLAGYGREAAQLARRLAAAAHATGGGRSCLEAGAPLQLTVDAPGPAALRVGIRLGDELTDATLAGLMAPGARRRVLDLVARLPTADHASLGTWLFWTHARQSIFVDLRDPSPESALTRLHQALDDNQRMRLDDVGWLGATARPWALRVEADETAILRVHVHWLLDIGVSPRSVADQLAPDAWLRAVSALAFLLRRPHASGRWVVATPLDSISEPALRIGSTGWSLVPEDDERKHRALAELMAAFGGPRDHAETLWSFCRGVTSPGWRVGRACELKVSADSMRVRLFLAPQVTA
jgi:hypothetical protein